MEKYEFDTSSLFEAFFGYRALPYPGVAMNAILNKKPLKQSENYALESLDLNVKESLISHMGVKYYAKNSLGNLMYMPVTLTRIGSSGVLLENTVITMTCKKTLVETSMVARQGTVKEEISMNDWEITIKGVIVGKDRYPEIEVRRVKELYEENEALTINNVLTSIFLGGKQERVVMQSLELNENKGIEIAQPFTMKLVSDTKFNLYLE